MDKRNFLRSAATGLATLPLTAFAPEKPTRMAQSLLVYQDIDSYVLIGNISRQELFRDASAAWVIQHAIDQFPGGGNIQLESGDYWLDTQLNLKSHVRLAGYGESTRLIFQEDHSTGVAVQAEGADRCTVADLSIFGNPTNSNGNTGIVFSNCGDCHIANVVVTGVKR